MATERSLVMVKPDGVAKGAAGDIISRFEKAGLRLIGLKMIHMEKRKAEGFYIVHRERPFYNDLTNFMSSGPTVVIALEGEGAIAKIRDMMGPTDSKKALKGTIRGEWGTDVEKNAVHGSDSKESASFEIPYFFNRLELF
ncbi:MAG: nucleoside-diphosphate kinase [Candidatus Schekmanbacteria bacterium RIFCSPHIGHO2_02_FULL_38_11]|uniref:Nucleoside diphosphate kinase n=1 Tax=Candidatus Schekmanbacteria bacterium RIFCSPLOWO2_12_FULL_38_15 TaxID=1817883 RepID=A0A1F7SNB8_9BACT|nr:MAG: nucleoside-diphosphate kinase [Candidatus Schekmanbacteria bacterium GWA2_38_9]OGL48388.1 MAG: nucleoside-diphosphate kinase [Candidatus Schekmanbacteria bacterium RIFCSPLOWO2_02_FULL_38_14]OGL51982.1 MAG: nucleoside-diphosphate kinase [Candidatus Schekmanbacteria bacterium RIFCSPHIGHO2_02_FULL_38_11]OGL55271.1 MAG: nucleoside-diphosphate kinase [Candidatus Schekmanbacteria bacterium RIFCSPLOWO2_12_FULL_38_15]